LPIHTLVVMPNDCGDFRVGVDIRQNALTDFSVTLHFTPLIERQRSWLFEESSWQADLSDVVDEPAQVCKIGGRRTELHAPRDVTRVNRDRGGMARRVAIASVKSGDQALCEREVRGGQLCVRDLKITGQAAFLLVEQEPSLRSERRNEEERQCPR
jgi:hypothetical protein